MARIWNKHKQFHPVRDSKHSNGAGTPLKRKVFVGMSGGVDSSVAAYLLKKQGYNVTGVFMRCWGDGPDPLRQSSSEASASVGVNCAVADAEDARRVAEKLRIPFYSWDFEDEYKKKVIEYMVAGYRAGLTPNPDVMCNREIKFGIFMERALALGADYVATGHYVRKAVSVERPAVRGGRRLNAKHCSLYAARDSAKDQSYFLWTLTQNELRHCLFPIGNLNKPEVRAIARRAGLSTAEKKDSQGICFLGRVTLADFLKEYISERDGKIVTVGGKKIGEHSGAYFYTIGQRHGLHHKTWNMKHETSRGQNARPFYVAEKNVKTNTLIVAEGDDHPALYRKEVELSDINLISARQLSIVNCQLSVLARVRYRQPLSSATLTCRQSSVVSCKLTFDRPQKFVAPGQSAVFYLPAGAKAKEGSGLQMLGGGVIV